MSTFHRIMSSAALLAAFCLTHSSSALNSGLPPSGNFDLSHWKLTLPTGSSGSPTEIQPSSLNNGYTNSPYFSTGSDGAMVFWAPVTGTTTGGSDYPRSELRQQVSPNNDTPNWSWSGTNTLDAQCKVTQVPSTGKVIIGQVHGYGTGINPLVKIYYSNGALYARCHNDPTGSTETQFDWAGTSLNTLITYQIKSVDGIAYITINGVQKSFNYAAASSSWKNQTFYFKAGSYCQDNAGTSSEGAKVSFYSLSLNGSVPPPTENQLALSNATASTWDTVNNCPPANAINGSLTDRWAGQGDGAWLQADLGSAKTVAYVKIAWYQGNTRVETFDVQTSADASSWTTVLSRKTSSGTTTNFETFDFADSAAKRYVRIVGHTNTVNAWNSVSELQVWGH